MAINGPGLRALLDEQRVKPTEIAAYAGVSPSEVYTILRGNYSTSAVRVLAAICARVPRFRRWNMDRLLVTREEERDDQS